MVTFAFQKLYLDKCLMDKCPTILEAADHDTMHPQWTCMGQAKN